MDKWTNNRQMEKEEKNKRLRVSRKFKISSIFNCFMMNNLTIKQESKNFILTNKF